MSLDIQKLLEQERLDKIREKKRLKLIKDIEVQYVDCDEEQQKRDEQKVPQIDLAEEEGKENQPQTPVSCYSIKSPPPKTQSLPLVERLDFSSKEGNLERDKQTFIDKLINSTNPLTGRSNVSTNNSMLRYGEYSPNNPNLRVAAAPYIGLGEYEQRRQIILQKQKADYLDHISKKNERLKDTARNVFLDVRPPTSGLSKSVQTDIQNIHNKLVQYELQSQNPAEKELSPQIGSTLCNQAIMHSNRSPMSHRMMDQRLSSAQNALLKPEPDKPRSILSKRSGSPRERLMSDLKHSYVPSFMDGFSYQEDRDDIHERERLKREAYQAELRQQIEEKRRLSALRDEQERREQELENRRLEQQLLRMQEEQFVDEQRRSRRNETIRRNSDDFLRRKHELQTRATYRKHTDSESSATSLRNTNASTSKHQLSSHYSPPVSRRNPYSFNIPSTSVFSEPTSRYNPGRYDYFSRRETLNRMDSMSSFDTPRSKYGDAFSRYDSLSRIDTLNHQDPLSSRLESLSIKDSLSRVQRRHSATQQDLRRSPKLQRKGSAGKFDDLLPIPVLKAHSPVAKELKNSIAVNSSSRRSSDAVRKLEDKWQIPAVQRNIINHGDGRDGQNRSILTQLGAMRMQLQQEQMRMDETLRKRGITQSKAVDFHC